MKHKTFYPHTRLDASDLNDLHHNQAQHEKHTAAMFSTGILHGLVPTVNSASITISPGAFIAQHTHNNTTTKNIFYVDSPLTISPLPTKDQDLSIYTISTTSDPITDALGDTHNRTTSTTFTTTAPQAPTYKVLVGSYIAASKTISLTKTPYAHALWHPRLENALEQKLNTEIAKAKTEARNAVAQAKTEAQNAITQAKKDVLNSAIPIGFIYTQFPNQPTPQQLWGNTMTWQNISSQYADCFFRAEGRDNDYYGAKKFQTGKQTDAIRDFTFAFKTNLGWGYGLQQNMSIVDQGNDWGWSDGSSRRHSDRVGYRFSVSTVVTTAAENRPVNYTVRIWKRTA